MRDSDEARIRAQRSWELARCTSWAFVYYLAETSQLSYLFNFGKELDKLPRMDSPAVLLIGRSLDRAHQRANSSAGAALALDEAELILSSL